jgi:hypothetical protein
VYRIPCRGNAIYTGLALDVAARIHTNAFNIEIKEMSRKEPGFAERLQTAAKAKQVQLEKVRATALTNDAQSAERQAARVETAEARKIRAAEHKSANRASAELREAQRGAEKARQATAAAEEKARKDAERVAQVEAAAALKQDQKAARDSKYAARKARQK